MEWEPFVNAGHLANEVASILQAYMVENNFHEVAAVHVGIYGKEPTIRIFVADGRMFEMVVRDTGHKWGTK